MPHKPSGKVASQLSFSISEKFEEPKQVLSNCDSREFYAAQMLLPLLVEQVQQEKQTAVGGEYTLRISCMDDDNNKRQGTHQLEFKKNITKQLTVRYGSLLLI